MKIREMQNEDIYKVAHLAHIMWSSHSTDELAEQFAHSLASDDSAIFVAEDNNRVKGFAQCSLRYDYVEGTHTSPVGYLEGIFVDESLRGRGYAARLLKSCEEWAREKGCSEFASDCELSNTGSLHFHLSAGFDEANRIICFTKKL